MKCGNRKKDALKKAILILLVLTTTSCYYMAPINWYIPPNAFNESRDVGKFQVLKDAQLRFSCKQPIVTEILLEDKMKTEKYAIDEIKVEICGNIAKYRITYNKTYAPASIGVTGMYINESTGNAEMLIY